MPFYINPNGETRYIYNGVEYSGYGGPDDVVGVSGEYAPGSQFNTGGGIDTSPISVNEFPTVTGHVSLRHPGAATPAVATPGVSDGATVNPEAVQSREVLGAQQDQKNPWDPMLVRRNAYDVGY